MSLEPISGIYALVNDLTGQAYVGQSGDLEKRMLEHLNNLAAADRRSYPKLRTAFNAYGLEAFSFQLLELCEPLCFNDREAFWIGALDARNNGYNERGVSFSNNRAYCEDRIADYFAELEAAGYALDLMSNNVRSVLDTRGTWDAEIANARLGGVTRRYNLY